MDFIPELCWEHSVTQPPEAHIMSVQGGLWCQIIGDAFADCRVRATASLAGHSEQL